MGLFDLLQIKTQNEDAFEEELKELETQKKRIIREREKPALVIYQDRTIRNHESDNYRS